MAKRKGVTKDSQPARDINHAERVAAAIAMRKAGHQWATIAERLSIRGGKGAAYNLVNNALKANQREDVAEFRELENQRMDDLLTVYWPKAMEGDGWSFDRVLRLMERRAVLNGLDVVRETAPAKPTIIEIPDILAQAIRGQEALPIIPDMMAQEALADGYSQ